MFKSRDSAWAPQTDSAPLRRRVSRLSSRSAQVSSAEQSDPMLQGQAPPGATGPGACAWPGVETQAQRDETPDWQIERLSCYSEGCVLFFFQGAQWKVYEGGRWFPRSSSVSRLPTSRRSRGTVGTGLSGAARGRGASESEGRACGQGTASGAEERGWTYCKSSRALGATCR